MKGNWIVGIAMLCACFAASAAGQLDIRLEHAQVARASSGGAVITMTLTNAGNQPIAVPDAYVPAVSRDGVMQANLLRVLQEDGSPVDYRGIYVSKLPGSTPDVILRPGESRSATVDLSLSYQIMPGRHYSVTVQPLLRYRELPTAAAANASDHPNQLKAATSNRIEVTPQASAEPQSDARSIEAAEAVACSAEQQSAIQEAVLNAGDLALATSNYTQSLLQSDGNGNLTFNQTPRYTKWYGQYGDPNDMSSPNGTVNGKIAWRIHVNAIRLGKEENQLPNPPTLSTQCNCEKQGKVDPANTVAWVNPSEPYAINICPLFFSLPAIGNAQNTYSKAGTILHEISHFNDGYTKGTDDLGNPNQPVEDAKLLAQSARDLAADAANNIEFYSVNLEGDQ
ncbi:M35 family metallo-endopeptidase [uncultured Xanthomonas sp.]|uniref:M35 family metallo-endopeptidase n=1 Tax=uncultured Xanthomonas sp. TaxID=152831 RepID=UPI0025E8EB80|nr:M35 family metallo-endopeptidase [uncultured Xanthomonas sp.]